MKDGFKLAKTKAKKVKKTIPPWASVSGNKKIPVAASFARAQPKVEEVLLEAVKVHRCCCCCCCYYLVFISCIK